MSDEAKDTKDKDKGSSGSGSEGLNKVVIFGGLACLLVAGIALAWIFSWVSDQIVGLLISGGLALILALLTLRVAFNLVRPALRYGMIAYVLVFAAVAVYSAKEALHLGHATASATLDETNSTLSLPSAGAYRLLVSGKLGVGPDAQIKYRLKGGEEVIDGLLDREMTYRRARRGPSLQVPEDHNVQAHQLTVSGASPAIVLDHVSEGSKVLVQAWRSLPAWLLWTVMGLVLLAGMFLEAKVPSNGSVVMTGAMAVCYGLVLDTAQPSSMALGSLWAALLAAMGGALGGSILAPIGRKLFGSPDPTAVRGKGKKGRPAADGEGEDEETEKKTAREKSKRSA